MCISNILGVESRTIHPNRPISLNGSSFFPPHFIWHDCWPTQPPSHRRQSAPLRRPERRCHGRAVAHFPGGRRQPAGTAERRHPPPPRREVWHACGAPSASRFGECLSAAVCGVGYSPVHVLLCYPLPWGERGFVRRGGRGKNGLILNGIFYFIYICFIIVLALSVVCKCVLSGLFLG